MKKHLLFLATFLSLISFGFASESSESEEQEPEVAYSNEYEHDAEYYQSVQEALDDIQSGNSGAINPGLF